MKTITRSYAWSRVSLIVVAGLTLFSLILIAMESAATPAKQVSVPNLPSVITVSGTQLIVQKRLPDDTLEDPYPYIIKGVNWSPASVGTTQAQLPGQFINWYEIDIPLMAEMGVNTIRTFVDFGTGITATQILDEFYANDIMVVMVVDQAIANSSNITATVNAYKNHPAILMWTIGNEWDINHYYGTFPSTTQSATFTEWAAQVIHGLDANHPVGSVLGDIDRGSSQPLLPLPWLPGRVSTYQIVNELVPSVDIWGGNIYRGATFGGLFGQWQQISTEPIFVTELGADSYDHRIGAENQSMQAEFISGLWYEIFRHLSALWPDEPGVGGLIFEWNDEWWKNGAPSSHNISLETNPGQPDGYNDEEWFGIVDIDRHPKQAYYVLQEIFFSNMVITATMPITLAAYSTELSEFFIDGAGFCRKVGGNGGGRGLNVAVINQETGAIEDCRNFDTWFDKNAFVSMSQFISDTIPTGSIVLIAMADDGGFIRYGPPASNCHVPWSDPRVEAGYQALESLGSTQIRAVGYWGSWAMIAVKGYGVLIEAYHDPIYNPPINGYCQLQSRFPTEVEITLPMTMLFPLTARDLTVQKSSFPNPVQVGSPLTYHVTVMNHGPLTATGIIVTDTLPSAVTFVSVVTEQGSCSHNQGVVICELGALGQDEGCIITMVVQPNAIGDIVNYATVHGDQADNDLSNNSATVITTIYSPTPTPTNTVVVSPTHTPTPTPTLTETPSNTPLPSLTFTPTPTHTPIATSTWRTYLPLFWMYDS